MMQPTSGYAGVLLDGCDGLPVNSGIDLLNSSPGSLALAVHL